MSYLRALIKGTTFSLAGFTIGYSADYIFLIIAARVTSPTDFGVLSISIAILMIVSAVGLLGLRDGIVKLVGECCETDANRAKQFSGAGLLICLVSGAALGLCILSVSPWIRLYVLKSDLDFGLLELVAVSLPFLIVFEYSVAILRARNDIPKSIFWRDICLRLGRLCLLLSVFLFTPMSVFKVFAVYTGTIVISSILSSAPLVPDLLAFLRASQKFLYIKSVLRFCLPLFLADTLGQLRSRSDVLILSFFIPTALIGIYSAGMLLGVAVQFLLTAFNYVFLPVASRMAAQGKWKEMKEIYQLQTMAILIPVLPFVLFLLAELDTVVSMLFGQQYAGHEMALTLLILGFLINAVKGSPGLILIADGKTKVIMWVRFFSILIHIIIVAALAPLLGLNGAAIAFFASLLLPSIGLTWICYQNRRLIPFSRWHVIYAIGAIIIFWLSYSLVTVMIAPFRVFHIIPIIPLLSVLLFTALFSYLWWRNMRLNVSFDTL